MTPIKRFGPSELSYPVVLNGTELLKCTEAIAREYCSALQMGTNTVAAIETVTEMGKRLRALLETPLKNPQFRCSFVVHFRMHPDDDIRVNAMSWMVTQLGLVVEKIAA